MSKTVNFAGLSNQNATAFVRPLSVADVPGCVEVESAFPEQERCSREKFIYRLTVCPEPSLGLFIERHGNPKTETPQLIAHVIGNRVSANRVTDSSMDMPEKWQESSEVALDSNGGIIGNDPAGRVIGVHSVAVRPEYQGKGLGRDLFKEYAKYVRESISPAESIVLIAHGHLLRFYESVGLKNLGPSPCGFAGGGWYDMELVV
ncbi:hypothetical protein ASPSYDRAFT_85937 [Aspergillus sydowii CBS 593.65]|uniref:N-acetyltransferase domain-containing protein n=1 Tax=Aspergillus sydowii CBS 593.65 TaxID=1036612 RepID=A0A1L9TS43_9EURO|nr:uncharacterized protein ASPSYDRAFT_85937 [Aspergillus sydowii CBS 593.65]OJJ62242.1 hypothetical protein ASPSYDRAFT_85937 [Aspergillus sydowii CBS 593.65]